MATGKSAKKTETRNINKIKILPRCVCGHSRQSHENGEMVCNAPNCGCDIFLAIIKDA